MKLKINLELNTAKEDVTLWYANEWSDIDIHINEYITRMVLHDIETQT